MKKEVLIPSIIGGIIGCVILVCFLVAMYASGPIRQPMVILALIFLVGLTGFMISYYITKKANESVSSSTFPINFTIGDGILKMAILNVEKQSIELLEGQTITINLPIGAKVGGSVMLKNNTTKPLSGNVPSTSTVYITADGLKSSNELVYVLVKPGENSSSCVNVAVMTEIDGMSVPAGIVSSDDSQFFITLPERVLSLAGGTNKFTTTASSSGVILEAVASDCSPPEPPAQSSCSNCKSFVLQQPFTNKSFSV